jgi:hypothetical protein
MEETKKVADNENNKETIQSLNQLLQGEYMAVESFNIFISKVEDENVKKNFSRDTEAT